MTSCFLSDISAKYYKNPSVLSRVIAKNVGDVFFEAQCIYHEKAVRPSVRLFVKRVDCNKTEESSAQIFYTIWKIIYPSFLRKRTVGGGDLYAWNFRSNWPSWSEKADFQSIFARGVLAVTPSEKSSVNTNRRSTTRFWMSLIKDEHRTMPLRPEKMAQKRKLSKIWTISCDNSKITR